MSIEDYITQHVAVVFTFLVSIIPLYIALRQDKERLFLNFFDEKVVSHFLARSIYLTAHATDKIFGRHLVSWQSFAVSILVSIVAFMVFFMFAVVTTPHFDFTIFFPSDVATFIRAEGNQCQLGNEGCDWLVRSDFLLTHYSLFMSAFAVNLFIDYMSTVVTRYLIRKLRYNDSVVRVSCILIVDVALDAAIFICGFALILSILTYMVMQLMPVEGIGDLYTAWSFLSIMWLWVPKNVEFLWFHVISYFGSYRALPLLIDTCTPACKPTVTVVLPLSTLMATSFATSIWIVFYAGVLLMTRVCARSFLWCRKAIVSVYDRPGRVVLWSCAVSVVYLLYPCFL